MKINGTDDRITIENALTNADYRIEHVNFADGTSWGFADLVAKSLQPSSGDQTKYGSYDGDALTGGPGNDTLYGGRPGPRVVVVEDT